MTERMFLASLDISALHSYDTLTRLHVKFKHIRCSEKKQLGFDKQVMIVYSKHS